MQIPASTTHGALAAHTTITGSATNLVQKVMASENDIQGLLRLLTGPAKIPLASAIPQARSLIAGKLTTEEAICAADPTQLQTIFPDQKSRKAVLAACKRTTQNKRKTSNAQSPSKRQKTSVASKKIAPSLPEPITDDEGLLSSTIITTNRAPLLLAFAVVALEYTYRSQPLACRLSLAGGVVAANSISKATSIGIRQRGQGDREHEFGMGSGQPSIKVLGKYVKCLRRYHEDVPGGEDSEIQGGDGDGDKKEPWYWALDVAELSTSATSQKLPIHTPESALSYLNRSFSLPPISEPTAAAPRKVRGKVETQSQIPPLPLLLGALHLLFRSWEGCLSNEELDQRAWGWYCNVRPEVPQGPSGWGAKGDVKLYDILNLRKRD